MVDCSNFLFHSHCILEMTKLRRWEQIHSCHWLWGLGGVAVAIKSHEGACWWNPSNWLQWGWHASACGDTAQNFTHRHTHTHVKGEIWMRSRDCTDVGVDSVTWLYRYAGVTIGGWREAIREGYYSLQLNENLKWSWNKRLEKHSKTGKL